MHRIPKLFSHSSDSSKSGLDPTSGRSSHAPKPRPRLDRRNAAKNINYDSFSCSSSASSSSYSSEESLRTRSLNLYGDKTSFRIEGIDGEVEIMCQTLGFAGIDDFTIPAEEYEAMKVRYFSAPLVFNQMIEPVINKKLEVSYNNAVEVSGESGVGLVDLTDRELGSDNCVGFSHDIIGELSELSGKKCEESPRLGFSSGNICNCRLNNLDSSAYELLNRIGDNLAVGDVTLNDKAIGALYEFHETGIKGVQPLVLAPPPKVSLPVIDKECSTWDILNAFAPDSALNISRHERGLCLDEDEEGTEEGGQKRIEVEEDRRRRFTTREENCELSESCSFTTNTNDDDSWSSTTETTPSISPIRRSKRNIVDWQKGELLGRGSFGSVYEAIDNVDGHFFAVKEVSLLDEDNEGKQCISQLEQEIVLLSQFEHENIVQYYGTMKDESHLYIFLQLVTQGSLLSLYQKYKLQDSQVSVYTRQILHGLKYLHDRNVVHRDIKCANLLVDTFGSVKLADFGLAKTTKLNDVKSCKGTAFWMAPEVVRSRGYGLAADIWSLGCTVLEMLTRRFPYYNLECMPALFKIGRGERPPIPDYLSCDSRDFLLQCLQVDPSLRPTAAQLLDHPFVKQSLPSSSGSASPRYFARKMAR